MGLSNVANALAVLRNEKYASVVRPRNTRIIPGENGISICVYTTGHERFYPEDLKRCHPPNRRIPATPLAIEVRNALTREEFAPLVPNPYGNAQKRAGCLAFVHYVPSAELPEDVRQALKELDTARTRLRIRITEGPSEVRSRLALKCDAFDDIYDRRGNLLLALTRNLNKPDYKPLRAAIKKRTKLATD